MRDAQLQVVMAWQLTWSEIAIETPVVVQKIVEHNAQILEAALASIDHGQAAGVEVSSQLVNDHPATALIDAASDSDTPRRWDTRHQRHHRNHHRIRRARRDPPREMPCARRAPATF